MTCGAAKPLGASAHAAGCTRTLMHTSPHTLISAQNPARTAFTVRMSSPAQIERDSGLLDFWLLVGKLKDTPRAGWVLRKVHEPESVAAHMHRMAVMALSAPAPLDRERCIKLALVHDIAEAVCGDITPHDNITKEEKHKLEAVSARSCCADRAEVGLQAAFDDILKPIADTRVAVSIWSLWNEYETASTPEARFVKGSACHWCSLQAP